MTTIQIRIDEKTKNGAKKVFDKLGIDLSTGIKMYLKQVTLRKGLPFLALTENGFTPEEEQEIIKAAEEAKKGINVTKQMSGDEAVEYLRSRI